jgi:hypothetical protein
MAESFHLNSCHFIKKFLSEGGYFFLCIIAFSSTREGISSTGEGNSSAREVNSSARGACFLSERS